MARRGPQWIPAPLKKVARPIARRFGLAAPKGGWDLLEFDLWNWKILTDSPDVHACVICHWTGPTFLNDFHSEMAICPRCGSIARDRFLMFCFLQIPEPTSRLRVLETSPRLGNRYRRIMHRYFDYTSSDFDLSAHEGDIRIDLQAIDLPDESVDVLITPHVLEHVPDTARALGEIHRILAPGGRMYLQIPLCQGTTGVPQTPEFHADNTPVFFRFGWDLTDMIRSAGFHVDVLVTEEHLIGLMDRDHPPRPTHDGFDVVSMWTDARIPDLRMIATRSQSLRFGFLPPHHFATWECTKT